MEKTEGLPLVPRTPKPVVPREKTAEKNKRPSTALHPIKLRGSLTKPLLRQKYTFSIEKGNNSKVIRRAMALRTNWEDASNNFSRINFKWTQGVMSLNYNILDMSHQDSLQIVNHFEYNREVCNKAYLVQNLQSYLYEQGKLAFEKVPATFIIDLESQDFKANFLQFLNFFMKKSSELDFISQRHGLQFHKDLMNFSKKQEFFCGANLWLLKPAGRNRGNGIFIFSDLLKLNEFLQNLGEKEQRTFKKKPSYEETLINTYTHHFYKGNEEIKSANLIGKVGASNSSIGTNNNNDASKSKYHRKFVIQKYLESPLLIKGRKFDIRAWVLIDYRKNLYLFREGYIRTSSEKYDKNCLDNYYIHLTNNAVQKNSKNYQKFELGNQLSYNSFQMLIDEERKYKKSFNFRDNIIPKMKELAVESFDAVKDKIDRNNRKACFEVFGFDFMIDSAFNVWLIEINTNPCLEESSPLLEKLIPRMIDDALKLTLDKMYTESGYEYKNPSPFKINGYNDSVNLWESLGNIFSKKTAKN